VKNSAIADMLATMTFSYELPAGVKVPQGVQDAKGGCKQQNDPEGARQVEILVHVVEHAGVAGTQYLVDDGEELFPELAVEPDQERSIVGCNYCCEVGKELQEPQVPDFSVC
jgi:hypothetical protein